jgi:NAD+ kinase
MENQQLLYYPVLDTNREKTKLLEKKIESELDGGLSLVNIIDTANAVLVWGWDGFMLDTIKKYYHFDLSPEDNAIFFGINCGTLGFLLNDLELGKIPLNKSQLELIKAHLIQVEILKNDDTREIKYALNDIVIWWNMLDYFKFDLDSQHIKKRFHGTGLIISTAMGSSAYRLNNWWPMIPAGSDVRWISGLASLPFWYQIIKPEELHISIKGRSVALVGVDWYGAKIDGVKEVTIRPTNHYATIGFHVWTSFDTKRMLLAEEKLLTEDF